MNICIVIPGGLDDRADRRIPCLQWIVERMSRSHSVEVFALRQSHQPESFDFAGARVHALAGHSLWGVVNRILRAHRRTRFDVVQAFWASSPGFVALVAARLIRRPMFVHAAGGEFVALPDIEYGTARTWKGRTAVAAVVRNASVVTVPSSTMAKAVDALGGGARLLPLGVDLGRWPVQRPPKIVEAPYRLIHVADLNRVKNQAILLRAMAQLNRTDFPFHLDVVGVDTLGGEMQQLAARLHLSDFITFHGWLPQHQVRRLMCEAHLFVLTSLHDAGPVAVREAAVCGVATVGTPVPYVADWAPGGAIAVQSEDGVKLASEIRQILRDDERRVALALTAQAECVRNDAEWTVRQFVEMYEEHSRRR